METWKLDLKTSLERTFWLETISLESSISNLFLEPFICNLHFETPCLQLLIAIFNGTLHLKSFTGTFRNPLFRPRLGAPSCPKPLICRDRKLSAGEFWQTAGSSSSMHHTCFPSAIWDLLEWLRYVTGQNMSKPKVPSWGWLPNCHPPAVQ